MKVPTGPARDAHTAGERSPQGRRLPAWRWALVWVLVAMFSVMWVDVVISVTHHARGPDARGLRPQPASPPVGPRRRLAQRVGVWFLVLMTTGLLVNMHYECGWLECIGLAIETSPSGIHYANWHRDFNLKWNEILEMGTTKLKWRTVTRVTGKNGSFRFDDMLHRWMRLRDTIRCRAGLQIVPGTERGYEGVWRAPGHEGW
jgi:hypothetical protein